MVVFASVSVTFVPEAVTAKRGFTEPGSAAPVVVVNSRGTFRVSATSFSSNFIRSGRPRLTVIVAVLVVSCSVIVPPPVRLISVLSSSAMIVSSGSLASYSPLSKAYPGGNLPMVKRSRSDGSSSESSTMGTRAVPSVSPAAMKTFSGTVP